MSKYDVMIVTTGRADYGPLYPLIQQICKSDCFKLRLVATGTHLSPLHGKTVQLIENDGIEVAHKVEMTMKGDTEDAICASVSTGLFGFSKLFEDQPPDLIVVLGDRYELWSICMAAVIHRIPIVHIHGGESTFGLIDDAIRHSITKMSAIHFASIDLYAKRILQMGEDPKRVFVVGAIGLDNIRMIPMMTREELSEFTGVNFDKNVALMTYHPVTLDSYASGEKQIKEVLSALSKKDLLVLMTMPNSDTSGNTIYQKMKECANQYPEKFKLVKDLGQKGYLSAMKYAKLMIGNSSSGIIESASFRRPVVNIGDRQTGRFKPSNVIDCTCTEEAISDAIDEALSDEFNLSILKLENPYGNGNTSSRIVKALESMQFKDKSQYIKKSFHDLIDLSGVGLQRII